MDWIVFSWIPVLKSYPLIPQDVTVFGDRAFKDMIKVKWDDMGRP